MWSAPGYTGGPLRSLLVLGVASSPTARRSYEDRLARALTERGVGALPSYQVLPSDERLGEPAIVELVRARGLDGVVVTRVLGVDEKTTHVPPSTRVVAGPYGRFGYYGYYGASWDVVHDPGYSYTTTIVRLETQLYDARSGDFVWGAQSDTFNPSTQEEIIESVAKAVSARLAKDGLVP